MQSAGQCRAYPHGEGHRKEKKSGCSRANLQRARQRLEDPSEPYMTSDFLRGGPGDTAVQLGDELEAIGEAYEILLGVRSSMLYRDDLTTDS